MNWLLGRYSVLFYAMLGNVAFGTGLMLGIGPEAILGGCLLLSLALSTLGLHDFFQNTVL